MALKCIQRDLDATLSTTSAFGVEQGGVLRGEVANPIPGIFDKEDVRIQNGEGVEVLVHQVTFCCATSDVPVLNEGDTFDVAGEAFHVNFWELTGDGSTTLYLKEGSP